MPEVVIFNRKLKFTSTKPLVVILTSGLKYYITNHRHLNQRL